MTLEYISMEQQLREDAEFYTKKAQAYLATKELDKAIGCLNKAIRKIKRADMLKLSPLDEAIFGPLLNKLSQSIAENILKGT